MLPRFLCGSISSVDKALSGFADKKLHAGRSASPCMRCVISDAHVAGNDAFESFCRGGKLCEAFFAKQVCLQSKMLPLKARGLFSG